MTLKELKERIAITGIKGYGLYGVTINYRCKDYHCESNNSQAWDRLQERDWVDANFVSDGYTEKQAYQAFYDECMRKNHLGKYNY